MEDNGHSEMSGCKFGQEKMRVDEDVWRGKRMFFLVVLSNDGRGGDDNVVLLLWECTNYKWSMYEYVCKCVL